MHFDKSYMRFDKRQKCSTPHSGLKLEKKYGIATNKARMFQKKN